LSATATATATLSEERHDLAELLLGPQSLDRQSVFVCGRGCLVVVVVVVVVVLLLLLLLSRMLPLLPQVVIRSALLWLLFMLWVVRVLLF
jgi:hypothetical protein